jgi:hypothetical protein
MDRRRLRTAGLTTGLLLVLALPATVAAQAEEELDAARAATEAFADVAAAEAAGYGLPPEGPLHECIANLDGPGAMGLHYINGDLVGDTDLDPTTPEALVYEATADGGLELVALEYVVFAEAWDAENDMAPMLFDEMFMLVEEPNRYELPAFYALHAWVWRDNPDGIFAAFNPDVACPATSPDTALPLSGGAEPWGVVGPAALVAVAALIAACGIVIRARRRSA